MKRELLLEIRMDNFPRKVKLANSRRAYYYIPVDKIPKKYLWKEGLGKIGALSNEQHLPKLRHPFIWRSHKLSKGKIEIRIHNLETKEDVVKNTRTAGTERWEVINGQKIYNHDYHPAVRAKIMEEIHKFYLPFLEGLPKIEKFPLGISCLMYDYETDEISGNKDWDVDNRVYPYCKAFSDVIQKTGLIPNDDRKHIIVPPHGIYIPITEDNRYFIFKIYHITQIN